MAIGDVVNGIGGTNALIDFQPAAGVEIMISGIFFDGTTIGNYGLYDGTKLSPARGATTGYTQAVDLQKLKVFITNTNYLRVDAPGPGREVAYCGIQIK